MATETSKRLFNVHEYHRMVDAGILHEDSRVELIRGEILTMSPIGPPHNGAVIRATNRLVRIISGKAIVAIQGAVRLDEFDEPQPDVVLLRPKDDYYSSGHAGPADILLIIEMADSSLEYDQTIKVDLYAETGIAEYWIADIPNDRLLVYGEPQNKKYGPVREFRRGQSLAPKLLGDCPIEVSDLLP